MAPPETPKFRTSLLPKSDFDGILKLATCTAANKDEIISRLKGLTQKDLKSLSRKYPAVYGELQMTARKVNFKLPSLDARKGPKITSPKP